MRDGLLSIDIDLVKADGFVEPWKIGHPLEFQRQHSSTSTPYCPENDGNGFVAVDLFDGASMGALR